MKAIKQEIAPITHDELTNIGICAVIAKAALFGRDPELNKRRDVYEPAKKVIYEMNLPTEQYERAVQMLAEAMGI